MISFRGRLFCNTICPVGTILGIISRISVFKLHIQQDGCTRCGKCQLACKANCIDVKTMQIDESRCISCFNCIAACESEVLGYKRNTLKVAHVTSKSDESRRLFFRAVILYTGSIIPAMALAESPRRKRQRTGDAANRDEHGSDFRNRGTACPPGSSGIAHLKEKCIGCQLCISSCPSKVLQPAFLEYGFTGMMMPMMVSTSGYCNYECTTCGEVCPTGAIMPLSVEQKKITQIGKVHFEKQHCVVEEKGTDCGSCSEHCPTQAVKMVPYKDGLTIPEINADICIGCGACEHACPVTDPHVAIYVLPNEVHKIAEKPKEEKVENVETEEFPF